MEVSVGRPPMSTRNKIVQTLFDSPFERLLSRQQRARIGRHILDRANGDNDDSEGNGETYVLQQIKHQLQHKQAVVFDIGANVGEWSLQFARGMTEDVTMYCFEPGPRNYDYLSRHVIGKQTKATLIPINAAVGNRDGEATLHLTKGYTSGSNSLYERHGDGFNTVESVSVPLITVDSFCAQRGIRCIDFAKIDTEGSEMTVLEGMTHLLQQQRVGCIQFEYSDGWIDARRFLMDVFEMLLPLGYVVGKIFPQGVMFLPSYNTRRETFQFANYLAVTHEWVQRFEPVP